MRSGLLCLLISVCASTAAAQSDSLHANAMPSTNAVYAELGGSALYYSFNYDRMVFTTVGYRVGFSLVEANDQHWAVLLPVFINFLPGIGPQSTSSFELDAGFVYHSSGVSIWYETADNSGVYYSLGVGFRYQSADDGILFRITLTPLFFSDQIIPYGAVSFGCAF